MFYEDSYPIYTPSFNPRVTIYHVLGGNLQIDNYFADRIGLKNGISFYTSYTLAHHSNGQNGSYYDEIEDQVNLKYGNFSTDYVSVGFHWSNLEELSNNNEFGFIPQTLISNGSLLYEQHLKFLTREKSMGNRYYFNKITISNTFISERPDFKFLKKKIYSYSASIYMGPGSYKTRGEFEFTYGVKPYQKMDFYFFARLFIGPDYYNLRHYYQRRAITVGIMADPLNIGLF